MTTVYVVYNEDNCTRMFNTVDDAVKYISDDEHIDGCLVEEVSDEMEHALDISGILEHGEVIKLNVDAVKVALTACTFCLGTGRNVKGGGGG